MRVPDPRRKIHLSATLVLVAIALLLPAGPPAGAEPAPAPVLDGLSALPAPADPVSQETAFVADINALRAGRGLPALAVDANLVSKARGWATTMAAANRIRHSTVPDGITADWAKLGENVGMGGSETALHAAFVASPHHFDNLVDPAFEYVGVGVTHAGNVVFVSQVFMRVATAATPAPTPAPRSPATIVPPAPKPAPVRATPVAVPTPAAVPAPTSPAPAPEPPPAPPVEPSLLLRSVLERLHTWES